MFWNDNLESNTFLASGIYEITSALMGKQTFPTSNALKMCILGQMVAKYYTYLIWYYLSPSRFESSKLIGDTARIKPWIVVIMNYYYPSINQCRRRIEQETVSLVTQGATLEPTKPTRPPNLLYWVTGALDWGLTWDSQYAEIRVKRECR
jgi:hypothetical protein